MNQGSVIRLAPNRLVFNNVTAIQGNYYSSLTFVTPAAALVLTLLSKTSTTIRE